MREKNKLKSGLLTAIMLLLCLSACNVRRPEMVLTNSEMADVLYDYHMSKSMSKEVGAYTDNEKQAYLDFVYQKHGITQEIFDSSLSWFSRNPEDMMKVYDLVFSRMEKENDYVKRRISERDNLVTVSKDGDTVNLWTDRKMLRMSHRPFENLLTFKLTADDYYRKNDTLRWNINYHFINGAPEADDAAVMVMQVWYDRDSIVAEQRIVREDGEQTITLQSDKLGALKTVQGFVYYPKQADSTKFLLLDNISLLRLHAMEKPKEVADTLGSKKDEAPLTRPVRVRENPKR